MIATCGACHGEYNYPIYMWNMAYPSSVTPCYPVCPACYFRLKRDTELNLKPVVPFPRRNRARRGAHIAKVRRRTVKADQL